MTDFLFLEMPSAGPGTLLFHLDMSHMSLKNVLSGSRIWLGLGPRASWGCLAGLAA